MATACAYNMNDYKNIAIDIYEKIQNIKQPNSPIYEIAAELYKYDSVEELPMNIMLMDRENLTIKLIQDLFKIMKKNHIRFKNFKALENYIKNNSNYSLTIKKTKNKNIS